MSIFFITGTSGCGKSTLMALLKLQLLASECVVYDFDEVGVPANADQVWRQQTTDYWLIKAIEHSQQNLSTIVCGVTVPSEVVGSVYVPDAPINFVFIKVADDLIRQRLQQRGWNDQLIEDNLVWAKYLEQQVEQHKGIVIDATVFIAQQVADRVVELIKNSLR